MSRWMDCAWAELGEQEVSGRDANPAILGYFKGVGRGEIASDEVAWCAAFAGTALEQGGISIDAIPVPERLLANSYLKIGTPIDEPRAGAICVLSRGSDPSSGHVGFVVGWTKSDIVLLGGNQADSVSTAHFPRSRIRGMRWPEVVTPKDLDAAGSRIAYAAKRAGGAAAKGASVPAIPSPPHIDVPPPEVIAAKAHGLQSGVESAIAFSNFLSARWPWIVVVVAGYYGARALWNSHLVRKLRAEDASTGKTSGSGGAQWAKS